MNRTNTLDLRFKDDLREAIAADPEQMLGIFQIM